jgi:hypothetical protein
MSTACNYFWAMAKSVTVPTSWQQVTLRQYMAYSDMMSEDAPDIDKVHAAISIFTGADIDEIKTWSVASFQHVWQTLQFLQTPIDAKRQETLTLNGSKYRVVSSPKAMSYGAFTGLMHFVKNEKDAAKNLHNAFACCLVERGRWPWSGYHYNADEHEAVAEAVLDLPVTVVKPNTDFFLSNYLRYSKRMLVYSAALTRLLRMWTGFTQRMGGWMSWTR